VSNNREGMEERTRDVVEGDEALAVALGTTMQRIRVVPCSVTELNSASICRHRCPFVQNVFGGQRQSSHPSHQTKKRKDGNKFQQQNPKCQQFLLVATCQAPENHGCTLRCDIPPPNPLVFFPMGQQSAPRYLGSSNLAPVFGFESVVHVGPLQYVL
jgi:hypothetical protein